MSLGLKKLEKVNDTFSINRYDNGWMVEINGRDRNSDYKTVKIICPTEEQLISLIKEYNIMELDN